MRALPALTATAAASLLIGCAAMTGANSTVATNSFSQSGLPDAVRVPAGHRVAMETVGAGRITYECRAKVDAAGGHEWFFVGPDAQLTGRGGQAMGRYFGPPATWESRDGSRVTATQVAVAPNGTGNIPLQLVRANPATGMGDMQGVSFIQRVNTRGGTAPSMPCGAGNVAVRQVVQYQADYIFYKPAM